MLEKKELQEWIDFTPKFKAIDDWCYVCSQHGSYGSLDLCLQEVSNYIISDIEYDFFLSDFDLYQQHYQSLCQQKIRNVRQECLSNGFACDKDWQIVHSSLIEGGEADA